MCESAREARWSGCGCFPPKRRHVRIAVCLVVAAILQESARRVAASPRLQMAVIALGALVGLGVVVAMVARADARRRGQGVEPASTPSAFDRELAALYEAEGIGATSRQALEQRLREGGRP
jgi:hypothetical protein